MDWNILGATLTGGGLTLVGGFLERRWSRVDARVLERRQTMFAYLNETESIGREYMLAAFRYAEARIYAPAFGEQVDWRELLVAKTEVDRLRIAFLALASRYNFQDFAAKMRAVQIACTNISGSGTMVELTLHQVSAQDAILKLSEHVNWAKRLLDPPKWTWKQRGKAIFGKYPDLEKPPGEGMRTEESDTIHP